jgi:hypothetical protein
MLEIPASRPPNGITTNSTPAITVSHKSGGLPENPIRRPTLHLGDVAETTPLLGCLRYHEANQACAR